MRRFNFPHIPSPNETFFVPDDQVNHLVNVLRMKVGELLQASDGSGNIFELSIIDIHNNYIQLQVLSQNKGKEIPLLSIAFIAELKNDAMDDSVILLAEQGIQKIIPFFSQRSIPKFDEKKIVKKQERRQKLANESIKKVGGLYPCTIENSLSFKDLKKILNPIPQKIVFWEQEDSPSLNLSKINYNQEHAFFIGPEGGFTSQEIELLLSWGCQAYSLGTRILRAPQAAFVAATLIRYFTENQETTAHLD